MLDEREKPPSPEGGFSELSSAGCLDNSENSQPLLNRQARISRGISLRENGCPGHNPGQPITWPFLAKKGPNSEINSKANRVRRQDVLDRPRHGSSMVLPWAICGRNSGACFRAQRQLERVAPHGADEPKGCSRGMKSRRGPSSRRPPQCRSRRNP